MSDFLSNFSKENYDGKKLSGAEEKPEKAVPTIDTEPPREEAAEPEVVEVETTDESPSVPLPVSRFQQEESEFDPTYRKKQQQKRLLIIGGIVAVLLIGFFTHYQMTHVAVPNFVGKEVADARSWASENDIQMDITQKTNFDKPVNQVISQGQKADQKIKKGTTLKLTVSLGADPEEVLKLPDFSKMSYQDSEAWIKEHKAENLSLLQQFDDTLEKDRFIKREFTNTELTDDTYRRKDRGMVYYSKGKEVFQENIEVPDFVGKNIADVTSWAKQQNLQVQADKAFSDTVAKDLIISQEKPKDSKVAQKSVFKVQVSNGKGLKVPDFAQYTFTEASALENKIPTVIKTVYSESVPYGSFISQSVGSDQHFGEQDELPLVQVVYSEGKPYLKDLRGSTNEGELPKFFYETFTSKGADITYIVYNVNSSEPKGTVVEMSRFGEFLPMQAQIKIGISLGNIKPVATAAPSGSDSGSESDVGEAE